MFKFVLFFIVGIVSAQYINFSSLILFFIFLFFIIISLLFYLIFSKSRFVYLTSFSLIITLILAGMFFYQLHNFSPLAQGKYKGKVEIKGKIINNPQKILKNLKLVIKVETLSFKNISKKIEDKILVIIKTPYFSYQYGEIIIVKGRLLKPYTVRKSSEFNYKRYLNTQGIKRVIWLKNDVKILKLGLQKNFIMKLAFQIKNKIEGLINNSLKHSNASVLKELFLGTKGEVKKEIKTYFMNSGVSHIFAISGLHVSLIVLILFFSLKKLKIKEQYIFPSIIFVVILYAIITGLHPPVIRATLMVSIFLIGKMFNYETDNLNLLSLVGLIMLIINPFYLFNVSFQLSFVAIFAIIYFAPFIKPFIEKIKYLPKFILDIITLSICVQIGLFPLIALYFSKFYLYSLLTNVLVIPLVTFTLFITLISSIFSFVIYPLSLYLMKINIFSIWLIVEICKWISSLPLVVIHLTKFPPFFVAFYYLIIFIFFHFKFLNVKNQI